MSKRITFNQGVEDAIGSGDSHSATPALGRCPTARILLAARATSRAADAVRTVRADRHHEDEQFGRDE